MRHLKFAVSCGEEMKVLLNTQPGMSACGVSVLFYNGGDGWAVCWRSCRFEESLGSSVSNVAVSMVTEGFPHCLESARYSVR